MTCLIDRNGLDYAKIDVKDAAENEAMACIAILFMAQHQQIVTFGELPIQSLLDFVVQVSAWHSELDQTVRSLATVVDLEEPESKVFQLWLFQVHHHCQRPHTMVRLIVPSTHLHAKIK